MTQLNQFVTICAIQVWVFIFLWLDINTLKRDINLLREEMKKWRKP